MKTLKSLLILMLLTIIGINMTTAGNSEKTEIRKLKNFTAIKVSAGIDLYITMGSTEEVKIVADDDIIDKVITEVSDGILKIYLKKTNFFNRGFSKSRKAYVTVKELKALIASSGSDVKTENTLKGENLKIAVSSGSDVYLDVIYKNLSIDTSSGSDAKLTGKVKYFEAEASSGSDIKAQGLNSVICKVRASSGSDAFINVSEELNAKASSGADIHYSGSPVVKNIDESSGGDVRKN